MLANWLMVCDSFWSSFIKESRIAAALEVVTKEDKRNTHVKHRAAMIDCFVKTVTDATFAGGAGFA
jgi:hypothetical protein